MGLIPASRTTNAQALDVHVKGFVVSGFACTTVLAQGGASRQRTTPFTYGFSPRTSRICYVRRVSLHPLPLREYCAGLHC